MTQDGIGIVLRVAERLWYGRFRRVVRRALRPLLTPTVRLGPLRGMYFPRGDAQRLGVYETNVQRMLAQHVRAGDVFWDVGANWGYFTLLASRLTGPAGCVIAFEPLPCNLEVLRDVVNRNGLHNVEVLPIALADDDGTATLAFARGECATPSLIREGGEHIEVRTARADSLVSHLRTPSVVKVDVEGAEVIMLDGAANLLRSQRQPRWILEVHSEGNEDAVQNRLLAAGYQLETMNGVHPHKTYPRHLLALPLA